MASTDTNNIEWPPWAMDVCISNETVLNGVLKDVFSALSHSLNREFQIESQVDHQFGSLQADGSYSGMLGALHKKEVEIAGPLVASEQRATVAQFTNCLGFSKMGIITGISSSERNMFLYANVFSWKVWLILSMTNIGVAFVSTLIYNVSVNGWKHDQISLLSKFFWVFWSYLTGHGSRTSSSRILVNTWNSLPFRILLAAWLLGPVINILFSFQGSMTSTFSITKLRPVVSDLDQLTREKHIIPVTTKGSSKRICFKASPDHKELWKRMENNYIIFSEKTVAETMSKVEKGTHVLIVDYIYALKIVSDYMKRTGRCSVQVEESLFCQSFIALALQKGTPPKIVRKVNMILSEIFQSKLADRWMNRIYMNYTHCTSHLSEKDRPLSITDIQGGFAIWGIGIATAVFQLIVEICQNRRNKKIRKRKRFFPNAFRGK